jgi:hypothetical protein
MFLMVEPRLLISEYSYETRILPRRLFTHSYRSIPSIHPSLVPLPTERPFMTRMTHLQIPRQHHP